MEIEREMKTGGEREGEKSVGGEREVEREEEREGEGEGDEDGRCGEEDREQISESGWSRDESDASSPQHLHLQFHSYRQESSYACIK